MWLWFLLTHTRQIAFSCLSWYQKPSHSRQSRVQDVKVPEGLVSARHPAPAELHVSGKLRFISSGHILTSAATLSDYGCHRHRQNNLLAILPRMFENLSEKKKEQFTASPQPYQGCVGLCSVTTALASHNLEISHRSQRFLPAMAAWCTWLIPTHPRFPSCPLGCSALSRWQNNWTKLWFFPAITHMCFFFSDMCIATAISLLMILICAMATYGAYKVIHYIP